MSGFWSSPTGNPITGQPDKAFLNDMTVIPDGTTAIAEIKAFEIITKEANQYNAEQRFIQITYKIVDGDFVKREVTQKIKVFEGRPEQLERNLNMLKLVMDLCAYKPTHNNEPTNQELASMQGKIVGIKIREWSMPKKDGSGMMEGNFVSEVHPSQGFKCEVGIKMIITQSPINNAQGELFGSALSTGGRAMNTPPLAIDNNSLLDDLPF